MKRILMLEKESDQITVLLAESVETAAMEFIAEEFGEDIEDSGIDFVMAIVRDLDVMFGEMPEYNAHEVTVMESVSDLVDRKSLLEFLSLDDEEE